ncbi:hypothetical protein [Alloactinosynnema sp. L-07]|uniref:hypothetical protein n=1 Tax=Alloactinosynnema sp. L-07 TaxID=1653480 RepID=UPI00065EFD19|nr:hypothetical protein [Alloactinosynnema sp. L-07]CRK61825.1 hypothetical protein [Alloactinosynnema sp. L-07]
MDDKPWWSPERLATLPPPEREHTMTKIAEAVQHHVALRTAPDELTRLRAARWLRANGLAALVDGPAPVTQCP